MPRAEVGTTKHISNQMKSKGLTRLRWFCQVCEKANRDANAFKMHCQSESHVRRMMLIGEDSRTTINEYSREFQHGFLQLLRTAHGEKMIDANRFYGEFIHDKNHTHMNSTKWASLTEFVKYLGREGICRVEEQEDDGNGRGFGLNIAWIDNSPDALRRQDALRKKERQDQGDEEREQRAIREQILRARKDRVGDDDLEEDLAEDDGEEAKEIKREDGEKIKLSFVPKKVAATEKRPTPPSGETDGEQSEGKSQSDASPQEQTRLSTGEKSITVRTSSDPPGAISTETSSKVALKPISLSSSKPKNVFAAATKKNAFSGSKKPAVAAPQKPMSEAERIMKEEIERKRVREANGGNKFKKLRVA